MARSRAVFIDRDGVLNRKAPDGQYILRAQDLQLLPGVCEGLIALGEAGYRLIVVTNQRCVALGLAQHCTILAVHRRLRSLLQASGARVDGIYYCPHGYEFPCLCRKPKVGLLEAGAKRFQVDLSQSWMVGDSSSDVVAGARFGVKTLWLQRHKQLVLPDDVIPDGQCSSFKAAAEMILQS